MDTNGKENAASYLFGPRQTLVGDTSLDHFFALVDITANAPALPQGPPER